jgi:ABC-type transport system involved in multi-copper enzyme maturation permease subunit
MIWLVFRRYRLLFVLITGLVVALGIWMYLLGRAFESDSTSHACLRSNTFGCDIYAGAFSITNQATALNVLLLFVPCLFGIVFGVPLVAGELERHTNRLAWTQGISRTKWLVIKWLGVFVVLVLLVSALTLVAQWWAGHTFERATLNLNYGSQGRIQPEFFPITGVAPVGYTAFAFAVGAAFGAVIRKVSWAIVGTVAAYTAVSLIMVLFIRPSLAPQVFVASPAPQPAQGGVITRAAIETSFESWNLGSGYRYAPGAPNVPGRSSADVEAQRCQNDNYNYSPFLKCLADHNLQMGTFYQPSNNYWDLQWRESSILILSTVVLLGIALVAVRRWRA